MSVEGMALFRPQWMLSLAAALLAALAIALVAAKGLSPEPLERLRIGFTREEVENLPSADEILAK